LAAGVQAIPEWAKASFVARGNNEQLLEMFVDAE
jgi:hypothetical protein